VNIDLAAIENLSSGFDSFLFLFLFFILLPYARGEENFQKNKK
jgi:hypothetical protein